jgi:hypothetical protein
MRVIKVPLTKNEIDELRVQCGNYLKLTIDLEKEVVVAGCALHADGENILLHDGSKQKDIWGGGIDLETKAIDAIAVLNLRPNFDNNSLEIIDTERRGKFINIAKKFFQAL